MKVGLRLTSVRSRVGLLVGVISVLFLIGAAFVLKTEADLATSITETSKAERAKLMDRVVRLLGRQPKSFVYDYTYWDEMIRAIDRKDRNWINVYIAPNGIAFDVDVVYVYDENWRLVYQWSRLAPREMPQLPRDKLASLHRTGHPFSHFFAPSGHSVVEIHGGSIHETSDVARLKPAHGHFLVGRRWDKRFLEEVSSLTTSEATVLLGPSPPIAIYDDDVQFEVRHPLLGIGGERVGAASLVCNEHTLQSLKTRHGLALALVFGFAALVIATLTFFLVRWVSIPLEKVSRTLRSSDRNHLGSVLRDPTELGEVASLVVMSLDLQEAYKFHNDVLEYRVRERTEALERAYDSTIEGWSRAMDARDHETEGHTKRVSEMSVRLGRALGLSEEDERKLYHGALLHDIGKMGVPDAILQKPDKLTPDEYKTMQTHTTLAADMLAPIDFLHDCIEIPLYHHEKWDGTGYPKGLKGEEIPWLARIFAVADVWDALRSDRPYREGWDERRVREYIASQSGTHFDPRVVEAYLRLAPMPHPRDNAEKAA